MLGNAIDASLVFAGPQLFGHVHLLLCLHLTAGWGCRTDRLSIPDINGLVGGWPTLALCLKWWTESQLGLLWKISIYDGKIDDITFQYDSNTWKNHPNVPNHQPVAVAWMILLWSQAKITEPPPQNSVEHLALKHSDMWRLYEYEQNLWTTSHWLLKCTFQTSFCSSNHILQASFDATMVL